MSEDSIFKSPTALLSPRLMVLFKVWQELAGARIAPKKSEITPAKLRNIMTSVWVMDVVGDAEDFRFRFAGDRIVQFMGRRYGGSLLSEHRDNPFFAGMQLTLAHCATTKAPLAIGPMRSTYENREYLEVEVAALPLSEDGVKIDAICGGFDTWPLGTHIKSGR
jgi:hypothetical protein